jgi:hypothetical protein
MREEEIEWGCGLLEMAGGGAVVASTCDMGAESMARARMVGGDRANRLDPRVSGRGA